MTFGLSETRIEEIAHNRVKVWAALNQESDPETLRKLESQIISGLIYLSDGWPLEDVRYDPLSNGGFILWSSAVEDIMDSLWTIYIAPGVAHMTCISSIYKTDDLKATFKTTDDDSTVQDVLDFLTLNLSHSDLAPSEY